MPNGLFPPLNDNEALVALLVEAVGEPRDTVIRHLIEELDRGGANVTRDARAFGLEPHVWSDRMATFYETTKAFLYACAVWNRSPLKNVIRCWIRESPWPNGSKRRGYSRSATAWGSTARFWPWPAAG